MSKKKNIDKNAIFFGIDYGTKKIGISIGQFITKKATPLAIIHNKGNKIYWEKLDKIILKWKPKYIVLGYPESNMNNKIIKKIDNFSKELEKRYTEIIEIINFSEVLSTEESKQVYKEMIQSQYKIAKRDKLDDLSASLILQSWFNENMID